jgi:hypothetical protein
MGSDRRGKPRAVLDGAQAMGYVNRIDPVVAARLHHVTAVLVLLSRKG